MDVNIEKSWKIFLKDQFESEYFLALVEKVRTEYISKKIFPPPKQIFRAFDLVPVSQIKVVILGQDPYHTPGVANGLAFSTNDGKVVPPSLRNIFKEIESDLSLKVIDNPDLTRWALQGVLLLNATLTVESNKPASHSNIGWETFTSGVIKKISENLTNVVFILWGEFAKQKKSLIDLDRHLVLESAHPSPFSANRGFFGSKPFSRTNEYLVKYHKLPINWK